MNEWTPPSRPWSPRSRLFAMAVLVAVAWLTANWRSNAEWPCVVALCGLAIGACHALIVAGVAIVRRQGRRAAIEASLCALFVGAGALAIYLIATTDMSSPC